MVASLEIAGLVFQDIASCGKLTSGNAQVEDGNLFTVYVKQRLSFAVNATAEDTFSWANYIISRFHNLYIHIV